VRRRELDNLSALSCATGLLLLAIYFVSAWLDLPRPQWLPLLISAIAGFEIFMVFHALRNRRAGGGSNG
jgi:hypothetical protein